VDAASLGGAVGAHEVTLGSRDALAPGIYWVRLTQAGQAQARKIVVLP
jgi:hypothetical protein